MAKEPRRRTRMKKFLILLALLSSIVMVIGCSFDKGPSNQQIAKSLMTYFSNGGLPVSWAGSWLGATKVTVNQAWVVARGKSLKAINGGRMPEEYAGQYQNCWPIKLKVEGVAQSKLFFNQTQAHPFLGEKTFLFCKDSFGKWSAQSASGSILN